MSSKETRAKSNPQKVKKNRKNDRVEDTNSDSLLSKLSVVSQGKFRLRFRSLTSNKCLILGYRVDPFLRELTSDPDTICSRRSPAINRGYLARLLALEVTFERVLLLHQSREHAGYELQVLSLGAGFDSMYFRLLNMGLITKETVKYFEVDFPHSMARKATRIAKSSILKPFFQNEPKTTVKDCFAYDDYSYVLIGSDMTKLEDMEAKLKSCHFDFGRPTVILTECSTTYIEASSVIQLVKWISDRLKNFMFISYEQIRPLDPFGRVMVKHFQKRNSPIRCVQHYHSIRDHLSRFQSFGWDFVNVETITDIWTRHMNESESRILLKTEPFDEAPELMLKCGHYVLITGGTFEPWKGCPQLENPGDKIHIHPAKATSMTVPTFGSVKEVVQRFGHLVFPISDSKSNNAFLVIGGHSPTSSNLSSMISSVQISDLVPKILWTQDLPSRKSKFSAGCLLRNHRGIILFGGRGSPTEPSDEMFKINVQNAQDNIEIEAVKKKSIWPSPRWGHTLTETTDRSEIILVGGRNAHRVLEGVFGFNLDTNEWSLKFCLPKPGLYSHSAVFDHQEKRLILSGGLVDLTGRTSDKLYIINSKEKSKSKAVKTIKLPKVARRFNHTSHIVKNNLILVGGVSPDSDLDQIPSVVIVDLKTFDMNFIEFRPGILSAPLVQHCSFYDENDEAIVIVGGGTNCFSFGNHVNESIIKLFL